MRPGGYLLYDSSWPLDAELIREGITILGIPFGKMCVETFERRPRSHAAAQHRRTSARWRRCSIRHGRGRTRCSPRSSPRRRALLDANFTRDPARLTTTRRRTTTVRCRSISKRMDVDKTKDSILIDGKRRRRARRGVRRRDRRRVVSDHAVHVAHGGVQGILRALSASTRRPGERKYALIQAEDELAAAGIVIGAGWAGARSFTSTAGPGISLMSEFIGLAYYTEIPGVFFDIQRTGPSHRHADAHAAGRPAVDRVSRRTATRSTSRSSRRTRKSASRSPSRHSISPSDSRRRCSS